jgi:DNA segregation ATPase FtsK/SpoIIIE-like protein
LQLGFGPAGDIVFANWREFGHTLVASLPGAGAEVVLTSLIGALTARFRPDALRVRVIADRRTLPPQLAGLPHVDADLIEPSDTARVREAVGETRAELERRVPSMGPGAEGSAGDQRCRPDLVLVIGELGEVADTAEALAFIGAHGPSYGVYLLGATRSRKPSMRTC